MSRILKIGLTGGIGAGKSTIAEIFVVLGIPIYYADHRARELMETDPALVAEVKRLLGDLAYAADQKLDRGRVAQQVFSDSNLLARLNYLVHPAVALDGDRWHDLQLDVPFTLKEAALTYESGQYLHLDAVICVEAPEHLRVERVIHRDQVDEEAVRARMANQWPSDRRKMMADFIITNDGSSPLIPQVLSIYHQLVSRGMLTGGPIS